MKTSTVIVLAACLLTGCGRDQAPPGDGYIGEGTAADWPYYAAAEGGGRYSNANQITPDNVHLLEKLWEHNSGDIRERGEGFLATQSGFRVTPIVVDDTLYYCSPFNMVFALNPLTGEEKWKFDPEVDRSEGPLVNCRGVSSWKSGKEGFCEHRILEGTLDERLIALDAETGKPCPDFGDNGEVSVSVGLSDHELHEYSITSAPAILGDLVITGAMVLDNTRVDVPSGVVRAYDVRTGELRWAWNPVPPHLEQLNPDNTFRSGTSNVWAGISVDTERNLVFAPTGNTSPDFYGGHREGLDEYSSSVVALDGDTGELVWYYRMVNHDIWDYDTPAQPVLVDLPLDGEVIPALVQVTKMGHTFVLNRETGESVWPVEQLPVAQGGVEGEYTAPTQPFPTHVPTAFKREALTSDDVYGLTFLDKMGCEADLEKFRNEGIFTPGSLGGTIMYPSWGGGNNWGSPAYEPNKNIMIVNTMRIPQILTLTSREECAGMPQEGTPYCASLGFWSGPLFAPCTPPPWNTIDAIDIVKGEVLWSVPTGTFEEMIPVVGRLFEGMPNMVGPIVTDAGVVFTPTSDSYLRAYALDDGRELWQTKLPTDASSVPMTFQLPNSKKQIVVVAAGGSSLSPAPPGDHLIAYALPTD